MDKMTFLSTFLSLFYDFAKHKSIAEAQVSYHKTASFPSLGPLHLNYFIHSFNGGAVAKNTLTANSAKSLEISEVN